MVGYLVSVLAKTSAGDSIGHVVLSALLGDKLSEGTDVAMNAAES